MNDDTDPPTVRPHSSIKIHATFKLLYWTEPTGDSVGFDHCTSMSRYQDSSRSKSNTFQRSAHLLNKSPHTFTHSSSPSRPFWTAAYEPCPIFTRLKQSKEPGYGSVAYFFSGNESRTKVATVARSTFACSLTSLNKIVSVSKTQRGSSPRMTSLGFEESASWKNTDAPSQMRLTLWYTLSRPRHHWAPMSIKTQKDSLLAQTGLCVEK